ncbi:MAG: M64 family metallopeptidase [Candidatus Krumholzibacteriia bacterium]
MSVRRAPVLATLACTLVLQSVWAQGAPRFQTYFTGGTLRIDFVHSGTAEDEALSIRRMSKEPVWSGSPAGLVPEWERGKYRFDVIDIKTGTPIYRHGFSTLFGEWQTTGEAARVRKAFEETLEMPMPRDSVEVVIFGRTRRGEMEKIFSARIDPNSHLLGPTAAPAGAVVRDIEVHGPAAEKVDVLILGDGYVSAEQAKFDGDCRRFLENFFGVEPFYRFRDRFNVRAVFLAANDAGIDEPRKGRFSDTPFGMTFSMFDLPRYCMSEAVWAMHDAASLAPHDAILLMGNSSRYGGGAIYNYYTVFVSDNEYDDYLTVHEFGHGFVGLADEYYTSAVAYSEFYPAGVEPTPPNITALLDPASLKWSRFVEPGTPIPTREDDERYSGKIGAFEGAGYAAKGLYRPARDCKMFSKGNKEFCAVCEASVVDMIKFYAPD